MVGIIKVASDEEALRLMNASELGLTAAIRNSGRGVRLSGLGYDRLRRPRSFHLRIVA